VLLSLVFRLTRAITVLLGAPGVLDYADVTDRLHFVCRVTFTAIDAERCTDIRGDTQTVPVNPYALAPLHVSCCSQRRCRQTAESFLALADARYKSCLFAGSYSAAPNSCSSALLDEIVNDGCRSSQRG
jgi:hypothetical protein